MFVSHSNTAERFWSKVDRTGRCWLWLAYCGEQGYGRFRFKGKMRRAHRVAYMLTFGDLPDELDVLHTCDTPSCVRPSHLTAGTQADNSRDMRRKRRQAAGERVASAKLTRADVREIRRRHRQGQQQKRIARDFHITPANVCVIVNFQSWRHV